MKIILRMNNVNYDITNLVDKNNLSRTVEMKHTINGEFHTASIYIPLVKQYELGTSIDFSRAIIRNSLVTIEIDSIKYQWRIMSDTVTNKLNDTYAHDIALIDRRSELTGINLPGLTLTQRSFVSTEKVRASATIETDEGANDTRIDRKYLGVSVSEINKNNVKGYMLYDARGAYILPQLWQQKVAANLCASAVNGINNKHTVLFNKIVAANDPSIIEITGSNIMLKKKDLKYNINLSTTALREIIADTVAFPKQEKPNLVKLKSNAILIIKALIGSTAIYSREYVIDKEEANIAFNFDYTPSVDNVTITLTAEVKSIPYQTRIQKLDSSYNKYGTSQQTGGGITSWITYYFPWYGFDSCTYNYTYYNNLGQDRHTHDFSGIISGNSKTCIDNAITISGSTTTLPQVYILAGSRGGVGVAYFYKSFTPKAAQSSDPLAASSLAELPTYISLANYSIIVETTNLEKSETTKNLGEWLDHILGSVFINEDIPYTLEASTRARLSEYISPEFTIKDYNLYQAISEVAEFLGGVDWEITPNNEIKFIFFDELPIQDLPTANIDQQAEDGSSDLNGYQSSLQINAENISLQSLTNEGWYNIRSEEDGNINISNDKIMIKTSYPINAIYKAEIKGINYNVPDYNASTVINITPRIVEYEEWKTLPSQYSIEDETDDVGRRTFLKGNTLYYKRGEPGIYGLGYCGGVEPGFWTTAVGNRAIFETGATQIFTENSYISTYNTTQVDQGNTTDSAFKLKIRYYPFTDAKTFIYKDDLSGFQLERIAYMNESAQVNDPNLLGSVAKSRVNRLGGTEYTKSGYISSMSDLPRLGSANSAGQRLTELVTQTTDSYIKYFATYINDYNKISTFVGKKSDYRLYEVPNKNILKSTRVKRVRFAIGPVADTSDNLPFDTHYSKIFENMTYEPTNTPKNPKHLPPNLVRLAVNNKIVYLPVITGNIGSTAFWKFEAKDNYSVGENYSTHVLDSKTWKLQQDVSYVNEYGNFDNQLGLTFLRGEVNFPQIYPDATTVDPVTGSSIFYEAVDYDKDAREVLSVEYQYSFHSTNNDKVMLFNGITNINSLFNGTTAYDIVASPCYYKPNKEDIFVDFSKIDPYTNTNYIRFGSSGVGLPGTYRLYMNATPTKQSTNAGMVLYDNRTRKLIMWIKYPGFVTPRNSFTTTVYVRMLDTKPPLIDVDFLIPNQFLELDIPNQRFKAGITGDQVSDYLTPYKQVPGYIFDGIYLDGDLLDVVYPQAALSSNVTLYLKYTPITSTKTWVETNNTIYDEEINPVYEYEVPPTDYTQFLPAVNNYNKGHVLRVRPYIITLYGGEYFPEYDNGFILTTAKYYTIV